ncbi:hypothetical protein NC652_031575 [Populus alba x Populus x berolinensis]|nr:hypothetical protein NC652_031575 [Populus alba x Populus x berolinensis]
MLLGHAPESCLLFHMGKNTRLIVICEGHKVITKKTGLKVEVRGVDISPCSSINCCTSIKK